MHTHSSPIHYHVNVSSIAGHIFDVSLRIENPDENGQTGITIQEQNINSWTFNLYWTFDERGT